jgi:hypothetical protein
MGWGEGLSSGWEAGGTVGHTGPPLHAARLLPSPTSEQPCLPASPSSPFQTAWRLSSFVAISYCNVSTIASWTCTRCNGISAGFEPQQVRQAARQAGRVGGGARQEGAVL